jgi:hypothetical protein
MDQGGAIFQLASFCRRRLRFGGVEAAEGHKTEDHGDKATARAGKRLAYGTTATPKGIRGKPGRSPYNSERIGQRVPNATC